jgi:hypothetical protein
LKNSRAALDGSRLFFQTQGSSMKIQTTLVPYGADTMLPVPHMTPAGGRSRPHGFQRYMNNEVFLKPIAVIAPSSAHDQTGGEPYEKGRLVDIFA